MNTKDKLFIEKATDLINRYDTLVVELESVFLNTSNQEVKRLAMDMVHLIYSYDPDIPAFGLLRKKASNGSIYKVNDVVDCLKYIIHYIQDVRV